MIRPYQGMMPRIAPSAYIDPSAHVIGDVVIGEGSSVWLNVSIRGDVNYIRIGNDTSIQDNSVLHVEYQLHSCIIGNRVTVGHRAVLHGCEVEDEVLIGIGAIILNGAKIGRGAVVAAGALVTEGMQVPPNMLAMGMPARVRREVTAEEQERFRKNCNNYIRLTTEYKRRADVIHSVKGMRDILPPSSALWNEVEAAARRIFTRFHYREIRTPILEETALFARSVGEDTDIVSKEMYTFEDRDGTSLTLRPENTASVLRAYIEHRLDQQTGLQKLYYIGPMFRRERPQKGRYRQFYQIGAEAIGSDSPAVDAEVIELVVAILIELGIRDFELLINSVGSKESRAKYNEALRIELKRSCSPDVRGLPAARGNESVARAGLQGS